MSGALLNLVRDSVLSDVAEHDYGAGSELHERHDEIKLATPDGDPCAIPTAPRVTSLDPTYSYLTGDTGRTARGNRYDVNLNIDYIGLDVQTRLEHWKNQRALVRVCPNVGRHTVFSWRPVEVTGAAYGNGDTAYDETGVHPVEVGPTLAGVRLWDGVRRFLTTAPVTTNPREHRFVHTPGGAAFGYPRDAHNRWVPGYPESASEGGGAGNSGWTKGGADYADLTFTHNPGGFGPADCPDSLVVSVAANASSDRSMYQRQIWDSGHVLYQGYSWTGTGTASVTIWLKGRLPDGASLDLIGGSTGGVLTTADLSGAVFNDWTPVSLAYYEATSWATNLPQVQLNLDSTTDTAYTFEVGAMAARQRNGTHQSRGHHWCPSGDAGNGQQVVRTVGNVPMPYAGTMISSFYVPADWDESSGYANADVFGSTLFAMGVGRTTGGATFVQYSQSGATSFNGSLGAGNRLVAGKVNTLALVWTGEYERMYLNGVHVHTFDRSAISIDMWSSPAPFYVAGGYATRGTWPISVLTARVDAAPMSDNEVYNVHLALTDPIALSFAKTCRGRLFEIVSIPATIRESAGGSQVLGNLGLRQVQYNHNRAEPTNREENTP